MKYSAAELYDAIVCASRRIDRHGRYIHWLLTDGCTVPMDPSWRPRWERAERFILTAERRFRRLQHLADAAQVAPGLPGRERGEKRTRS